MHSANEKRGSSFLKNGEGAADEEEKKLRKVMKDFGDSMKLLTFALRFKKVVVLKVTSLKSLLAMVNKSLVKNISGLSFTVRSEKTGG